MAVTLTCCSGKSYRAATSDNNTGAVPLKAEVSSDSEPTWETAAA